MTLKIDRGESVTHSVRLCDSVKLMYGSYILILVELKCS